MNVAKRDRIFIAVIIVVLSVLFISTSIEKGKKVPYDDKHRQFYELMDNGMERVKTEKGCAMCHSTQSNPLPKDHPPKEQCLICHKLSRKNK